MEEKHPLELAEEAFMPGAIRKDLIVILVWLIAAIASVYLPVISESPLRAALTLPVILFIPGYLLIAALFPSRSDLETIERVALSFGLSVAVVPLIGLVLNYTPWGIRLDPIITALFFYCIVLMVAAQVRSAKLPAEERFRVPVGEYLCSARSELFPASQGRLDRALSVLLLAALLIAVATTVFVIVVPKEGERFTEFYILGEKGMAADYPTSFSPGTVQNLTIGIGNHEYRTVEYTVEALLVSQSYDEVQNVSVISSMDRIDSFRVVVPHNSTMEIPWSFSVPGEGPNRLQLLLYNETVPDDSVWGDARVSSSYRDLHLWFDLV